MNLLDIETSSRHQAPATIQTENWVKRYIGSGIQKSFPRKESLFLTKSTASKRDKQINLFGLRLLNIGVSLRLRLATHLPSVFLGIV